MELDKVGQYLTGMSYAKKDDKGKAGGSFPFIAISRQAGAGGHSLTEAVMEEMEKRVRRDLFEGWQVFDEALCRALLGNPKLKVLSESLAEERFRGPLEDIFSHAIAGLTRQDKVYAEIFECVRDVASAGKSIIVGRGAACLMRGHPGGVFVRLVAPLKTRVEDAMSRLHIGKAAAEARVREQDAARAALVRRYFRQDIDDPLLYDLVWNAAKAPLEVLARVLVDLVEERAEVLRTKVASPR